MEERTSRNSSFELIKIIAIVCIVFCHSIPTERIEYHFATINKWQFGIMMFRQLGSIGNAIFIVASTWFLTNSDEINLRKIKQMITDNQIISIIFLIVIWYGGYDLTFKIIIKQLFPFLFATLWYITCYIIYYMLHGFINKALYGTQLNLKQIILFFTSFDLIVFVTGSFYFNELIGFIMIHILTWYLKKAVHLFDLHKIKKYGKFCLIIGFMGWFFGALILNLFGIHINYIGQKFHYYNRFYNPFILFIAYGFMLIAQSTKLKSNIINKLSSYSLYIYMITGNQLLRVYLDNVLYDFICNKFGTSMLICFEFVIIYSVIKFILGLSLAIIYKIFIARIIGKITSKEYNFFKKILKKII